MRIGAVVLLVFQNQISGMIQQTRLVCEVPCRVITLWPGTEAEVQVVGMWPPTFMNDMVLTIGGNQVNK